MSDIFINLLGFIIAVLIVLYTYFKWSFSYWSSKNVAVPDAPSIPFGNIKNPFTITENFMEYVTRDYNKLKKQGNKYFGLYILTQPIFVPIDNKLVKHIMAEDFQYFVDRGLYVNEKHDPISAHLFAIGGTKWKNLRAKLTPTFTSGKMKTMFPTLVECGQDLEKAILNLSKEHEGIDIKEIVECFTTNIIGSCAFGLKCNTFEDKDSSFRKYGKQIFEPTNSRQMKILFGFAFTKLANMLGVRAIERDTSDFFSQILRKTMDYREKNNYVRKDFLQLLIDLNKQHDAISQPGKTLTFDEIVAQSFVFFIAGFETSSTTSTYVLYELANNQDVQDKVRAEINTVLTKHNGEITYDAMNELKYMGQVIDEALRKYPPLASITRVCVKDYRVPHSDLVIKKGVRVMIPVISIHYDEEYYPNPTKFDPERFNEENKATRNSYMHLPFGEGPRLCIGMRFGMMQTKVGLTILLKSYKFTVNKKTKEPLRMDPHKFITTAMGGIWLNAEKVN